MENEECRQRKEKFDQSLQDEVQEIERMILDKQRMKYGTIDS